MGRIHTYDNYPESVAIKQLLEDKGIPVEIHSFEEWGYDGVFRGQIGMGEIIVPEEYEKEARTIVHQFVREKDAEREGESTESG